MMSKAGVSLVGLLFAGSLVTTGCTAETEDVAVYDHALASAPLTQADDLRVLTLAPGKALRIALENVPGRQWYLAARHTFGPLPAPRVEAAAATGDAPARTIFEWDGAMTETAGVSTIVLHQAESTPSPDGRPSPRRVLAQMRLIVRVGATTPETIVVDPSVDPIDVAEDLGFADLRRRTAWVPLGWKLEVRLPVDASMGYRWATDSLPAGFAPLQVTDAPTRGGQPGARGTMVFATVAPETEPGRGSSEEMVFFYARTDDPASIAKRFIFDARAFHPR